MPRNLEFTFQHKQALRIFGPAGSGKTRAVIEILQQHVADGDFRLPEGIICSFTRAAAQDIARRVNPDGEPGRYHCTIHALCKRYYGFDGEIAETKLRAFFRDRLIRYDGNASSDPDEWMSTPDDKRTEGSLLVTFWNFCRNRRLDLAEAKLLFDPEPEIAEWWADDKLERLYHEYGEWKRENNLVDFTDMLEYAAENPPAGWWPFFVLDEAQDCTPLQWQVAQGFAACADVVYLAGDDDQAIYEWAGATPHEFLRARVCADDVLNVNHRSARAIVEAAQGFIRQNTERRDKGMVANRDGGRIVSLQAGDFPQVTFGERTFVMARAHYLNNALMDEFTGIGFPFVDRRGKFGVNGRASEAYKRFLRLGKNQAITVDDTRLLFEAVKSDGPWLARGTKTRLQKMEKAQRLNTYVRIDDLGYYGANEELINAIKRGDISVLGYIDQERLGYLREVERRYGAEWLDERKAAEMCQVGSVHAFKGLECDTAILHDGMPMRAAKAARLDPEPERRVFYVAMSRAKERLIHYNAGPTPWATWKEVL